MTSKAKTPADELRFVSMGAVWGGAFAMVVILCGIFTPWDALLYLLENQGAGDEGASVLAFIARVHLSADLRLRRDRLPVPARVLRDGGSVAVR
jgi:hypothetical protein